MIRRLKFLLLLTAVAALWLTFGTSQSLATPCGRTDAKVAVVNKSGKTLKSVLVVHRVGKKGDDIQPRAWANLANGKTGGAVDISFIATKEGWSIEDLDWWTVFYSFEQIVGYDGAGKPLVAESVFRLEPYNGQETLDDMRSVLQDAVKTLGPAELKAITEGSPLNPFLSPLVDPAFKLLASLMGSKGGSLAGYKQVNLQCKDAGKTVTITIGKSSNPLTVSIAIPGGKKHEDMVARNTLIDSAKLKDTILARLAGSDKTDPAKKPQN